MKRQSLVQRPQYHETRAPRPREVWREDKWPRRATQGGRVLSEVRRNWRSAEPMERAWLVFKWIVSGLTGILGGLALVVVAVAIFAAAGG